MIIRKNKNLFVGFSNEFQSTSLQGYITIHYSDLVNKLGLPNGFRKNEEGAKMDAEWRVFTPFGVGTIYNYKNGKNYLGEEGLNRQDIVDWHIGGQNGETAKCIINELLTNN